MLGYELPCRKVQSPASPAQCAHLQFNSIGPCVTNLDSTQHDVVGDLAGITGCEHVVLGLLVQQLEHLVVLHPLFLPLGTENVPLQGEHRLVEGLQVLGGGAEPL